MKRAVGYISVVLGWSLLISAVFLAGIIVIGLLVDFRDLILRRVALAALAAISVGVLSFFLIRWARSALGTPGGSRVGRIVLGIVMLVFGIGEAMTGPDPDATRAERNGGTAGVVTLALFGAALIVEAAWWHRASKVAATALPEAPPATADSPASPEIALPEPPPGP
jgi:4-amino-4-deoxy-L-arabinose transferase-like glycosyltransferase